MLANRSKDIRPRNCLTVLKWFGSLSSLKAGTTERLADLKIGTVWSTLLLRGESCTSHLEGRPWEFGLTEAL